MRSIGLALALLAACAAFGQTDPRVERILTSVPLIDGHNDLPWQFRERVDNRLAEIDLRTDLSKLEKPLHTDIPRLRAGRVGGQFWSVYVPASIKGPEAVQATIEQIDVVHRLSTLYPDTFEVARTADDIERIHRAGKIASLIGVEGGYSINNSLAILRSLYELGTRYMTLTHSTTIDWADSATADPRHGGLSPFGREVIAEMNRLGMLVDLSHVSPETMHDTLDATLAPVIFSHSSVRALTGHSRNVPDDVLKRLPQNGGIVMITFVPSFISEELRQWHANEEAESARLKELHSGEPHLVREKLAAWQASHVRPQATLADVANHIEHAIRVAGEDHVGIGGDLDGISSTPVGLSSVADYPALLAELLRRGHSEERVKKIAGGNALRVLRGAEKVAARLRNERKPNDARIELE
jgi:membrane dipeptidase